MLIDLFHSLYAGYWRRRLGRLILAPIAFVIILAFVLLAHSPLEFIYLISVAYAVHAGAQYFNRPSLPLLVYLAGFVITAALFAYETWEPSPTSEALVTQILLIGFTGFAWPLVVGFMSANLPTDGAAYITKAVVGYSTSAFIVFYLWDKYRYRPKWGN